MAKKISILNFKGGVGKTTTCINLGAALNLLHKTVLIVDIDSQANTTYLLGYDKGDGETIYDSLEPKTLQPLSIYENRKGLDFVAADERLGDIEELLVGRLRKEEQLKRLLAPLDNLYDYILIDCPPNRGLLTINAMCASDSVLIPIDSQLLALQGLEKINFKFREVKEFVNPTLEIEGYLITKYKSQLRIHRDVWHALKDIAPNKVFNAKIRDNVRLSETPSVRQDIFTYAPDSIGAEDYMQLAREITGIRKKKGDKF